MGLARSLKRDTGKIANMTTRFVRLAALAAAALLAGTCLAQGLPVVFGEPARTEKQAEAPRLRMATPAAAQRVQLAPVTDQDVETVRAENRRARIARDTGVNLKRVVVGINRGLEVAKALGWTQVAGGRAARLAVTSPDAAAMRASIDLLGVPTDTEMVFFGSRSPDRLFGPYRVGEIADRSVPWWSPMTEGETLTVEFFAPGQGAGSDPRIAGVGHFFTSPAERGIDKRLQDIGDAGSCNVDIPCSSLTASSAFRNVAESVAQMVFVDSGFAVLCTGTLLNDMDASTQKPWFFSANHCFDNASAPFKTAAQMQAVANTLTTLWLFEASACGSGTLNPGWQQLGGGATYLYSNAQSDALFLRLNAQPPNGAFFAGWDANAVSVGSATVGIHHPQGDLKKVSEGSIVGFARWDSTSTANQYIEIRWSSGTTEGGSSGSGLFTLTGSQYLLRGGLRGGSALCTNPTGTDFFSRFDQIYPAISQYLSVTPSVTPFANVTSLWWIPSESGWGLNLIHRSGSNIVFGTWYTYGADGKRTWFVMPSGSWSSPNTYSGTLYTTSGPAFTGPFDPALVTITPVGTGTLTFSDANNATWTYSVNGLSGTKSIRRFEF